MSEKFLKNTIYVILSILLISFILIQPYNLFCRIKHSCDPITLSSIAPHKIGEKSLTISFLATTPDGLKNIVEFQPKTLRAEIINGQAIGNYYSVKNLTNNKIIVSAKISVEPKEVDQYLEKIECLCMQSQPLNKKESAVMPARFRINPEIEKDPKFKDLKEIKINYEVELIEKSSH